MSNQFHTLLDETNNKAVVISASGVEVCALTQKPPERKDYADDEAYKTAVEAHYSAYPEGYRADRVTTLSQTGLAVGNMIVNNVGITFPDSTSMTTAATGGGTTLSAVTANNSLSDSAPTTTLSTFSSSSENHGLARTVFLPGPNGSGNGIPETCNSMIFLTLNADLTSIGMGNSVACYVPCYFYNPAAAPTPTLEAIVVYPTTTVYLENSTDLQLYEGDTGPGGQVSSTLYPRTVSVTLRVNPAPSSDSIILSINTTSYPSERLTSDYTSYTSLTPANNYAVTWTFNVIDNLEQDLTRIGYMDITTGAHPIADFNNLSYRLNFEVLDYQDGNTIQP